MDRTCRWGLVGVLVLAGCGGGGGGGGGNPVPVPGSVRFDLDVSPPPGHDCAVDAVHAVLTLRGGGGVREADLAVDPGTERATATIADLASGTWDVLLGMWERCLQVGEATGAVEVVGPGETAVTMADLVATCLDPDALPAAFTSRVVIEVNTAAWCHFCPEGATVLGQVLAAHPGRVYGATFHDADPLEPPERDAFVASLGGQGGFPSGAVNRTDAGSTYLFLARAQWEAQTTARLGETATCGLRIDSTLDGADATVRVVSAFLAVPANPVRLTVYLVEDGITGVAQAGVDGPYVHDHVVRGFLTAVTGDAIAAGPIETGVAYASEFAFVVPEAWAAGNVSVVALVNEFDSDPAALDAKRVLNVQSGPLGSCTTW